MAGGTEAPPPFFSYYFDGMHRAQFDAPRMGQSWLGLLGIAVLALLEGTMLGKEVLNPGTHILPRMFL